MGCASSTQPQPAPQTQQNNGGGNNATPNAVQTAPAGEVGHSQPLQEPQRWSSKRKITRQQLEGKREEFWHTCQATNVPAVWQQIRTVCEVMTGGDLATANAICQAANIITPEGSLTRCYDQFGNLVRSFGGCGVGGLTSVACWCIKNPTCAIVWLLIFYCLCV